MYPRVKEITVAVEHASIPPPKRGNARPREVDEDYGELPIGMECSRWREQLETFCKAFQEAYDTDKTHRDIRIPWEARPIDTDLREAIRKKMTSLGYTQILQSCRDVADGKTYYQSL